MTISRFVVCYLGTSHGMTVLAEHISKEAALNDIRGRDFSNSSLDGSFFYIFEVTRVDVDHVSAVTPAKSSGVEKIEGGA